MKTSVVMSTYNGEKYITEQLDSLHTQSQLADEVIIADDCSTDHTVEIVRRYINQNNLNNWKVIVNQHNKGWRRNFMEAMWSASGDLVFPCDQDDIWRNDKIKIMTQLMDKNPQIKLLTSNYCEFFEDGKERIDPWKNNKELKQVPLKDNYLLVNSPGCTYCVRKELLVLSKNYWQPDYPHDALLWRMGLMSNGVYTFTDDLIKWRNHKKSAFAKESKKLKSVSAKKSWIKISADFNNKTMREFIKKDVNSNTTHQDSVLDKNSEWLAKRKQFYDTSNPIKGIQLLKYIKCYPRLRQYLGDWYLIYLKK
ncbi:glycosyltransferase [Limosilactobacillus sp. RRLNB_1_1]|uniref:Glycosyltransferase n=1 Tax=Limosilactobacillus albertensis TaxID=2759752 RepID=A0A7W3Y8Y6_9LACO|nr:glycosyltransferase [Limosilactobacillus albertensis]MBB1070169.1 glycosyltransferase [Limosilactobacillus albertensis]MCD7118846.1 glycosyltransferase [Limosilactobacillus albertensis]MCD7128944.1 glycosyltransferase [Limosilactobacillus albertensis]